MTWHGCAAQAAPFEEQTKLLCELTKFFLHKSRSLSHHLLATSEFADFDGQEEHAQKQSGVCADLVPKSRVPLVTVGSCR